MKDYDLIVLTLTRDLIQIMNTREIPKESKVPIEKRRDILALIVAKKYEMALELHKERCKKRRKKDVYNVVTSLLMDIIDLCNEIIETKEPTLMEKESEKKEEGLSLEAIDNNHLLKSAFIELVNGEIASAENKITTYLNNIGQSKYLKLIGGLITICIFEGDKAYVKPMSTMCSISKGTFVPPIDEYIEDFRWNLSNSNFRVAEIYLEIIKNYAPSDVEFVGLLCEYKNCGGVVPRELQFLKKDIKRLVLENRPILQSFTLNLLENRVSLAVDKMEVYLSNIGQSRYFKLVADLISISQLENDRDFKEPLGVINEISTGLFVPPIDEYIQKFEECTNKFHIQQSMIYLEIIREYAEKQSIIVDVDELAKKLEQKGKSRGFTIKPMKKRTS